MNVSKIHTPLTVVLSAGGTGGHLFPAVALAKELKTRGHNPHIITDERGEKYSHIIGDIPYSLVSSETIRGRNPISLAKTGFSLIKGFLKAYRLMGKLKPSCAIGFGGYPTLPPIYAARMRGIPYGVHDANAVLGRANKALADKAKAIAISFEKTSGLSEKNKKKAVLTGNPLRQNVLENVNVPYPDSGGEEKLNLLVFGGSQGAQIFAEVIPQALEILSPEERSRINLVQQAREENLESLKSFYQRIGLDVLLKSFFDDLPQQIANSHLVISRSGAGTVAELAAIGRPAILIPLASSIDNDQLFNAKAICDVGGSWLLPQSEFSPTTLAKMLSDRLRNPEILTTAAQKSHLVAKLEATKLLADLTEKIARQ